jgi:two-component system, cell cycle response regulator DivK
METVTMSSKILYVEDNPQNMRLVRKILTNAGYHVIEANEGEQGLRMVVEQKPDLILLDINLPDIDGLEVTKRLKSDRELRYIPVIALTANAMHGDRERCIAAGCNGYLPKPITKSELLSTVAQYLAMVTPR